MKRYHLGAHTKHDLKVHLVWIPKYREAVLTGQAAIRTRDLIRQISMEPEITILSGKVARDYVHVPVTYSPHVDVRMILQWLKSISFRILVKPFAHLKNAFGGRHFGARGYLPGSTGNLTDEMVTKYIAEQRMSRCSTTVDLQSTIPRRYRLLGSSYSLADSA
jgi:putative transposase